MKMSISKKLLKNYISMYVLAIVLTLTTITILFIFGSKFSDYSDINYAEKLINNEIDINVIKEHSGTAFIINKDLNVIPICGEDLPENMNFTIDSLTDYIKNIDSKNKNFDSYIKYDANNQNWTVVKLPVAVNCYFDFNINTSKEVLPEAIFILLIICFIVLFITYIYIFIYSKLTCKYFVNPLEIFSNMVRDLEEGKYTKRLDLNKDDEFGMLANSFNNLADSLEREKYLREKSENNRKRLILDISHDLNNPLASTIGSLELCLSNNDIDSKYKHYLTIAYENSKRAKTLIRELFEYSKLDSPDYNLEFTKIDFCEYMRMQIASEIDFIEEAKFTSEYYIPDKIIYAEIDTIQFSRVIHNLISNSIKYNKEYTNLKIQVTEIESNIEIIISDDGIGMDKNSALRIFDVFTRNNKGTQTSGTGLGLTIVKKIVTMHNGEIYLKTDINSGCEFKIIIPKFHNN